MIYCPHCGTPNKPNSKFCKNCAALLSPSTDVRCPICGMMNPQGAATCENCGTRLSTSAAGALNATDNSTPADAPEQIAPFNPPPLAPENTESEPHDAPTSARPTFGRASSEWLRRIQKTPPPETTPSTEPREPIAESAPDSTAAPAVTSTDESLTQTSAAPTPSEDNTDWLRALDAEQGTTKESSLPAQSIESVPAASTLSEIKLTRDDYDYSDIGGEVTDEMKTQLEASASNLTTTEDEVELARRLLGLSAAAEIVNASQNVSPETASPTTDASAPTITPTDAITPTATQATQFETVSLPASESVAHVETPDSLPIVEQPTTTPTLSEIKLTRDDYDYSDIGGEVTDEMKTQLEASASNLTTTEDEVELARRLLGLDIAAQAASTLPQAPPAEIPAPLASDARIETPTETATPIAVEKIADTSVQVAPPAARETIADAQSENQEESADWLAAVAAASTAVVAGAALDSHKAQHDAESAAETPTEAVAAQEIVSQPSKAEIVQPIAETSLSETVSEQAPALPKEAEAEGSTGGARPDTGELPEWVHEIPPPEAGEESTTPEWVKGIAVGAAIGSAAYLSELPELDESEREDLPDWLREPVAEATPDATVPAEPTEEPSPTETPELVPALELPSWFANATVGAQATRDPFETIETTGPLAGVSGILPLAVAIAEPHTLTTPTPARSDGGRIFQTILAEPLATAASTRTPTASTSFFKPQHLLYLILFLAALIPLFLPLDQAGLGLDASKSPTALFYDQLQAVPADSTVLLAFDYTPGQAVELDPAARAIVNELVSRQANVIAISSNPNGATIAQTILGRAHEAAPQFTFVNVGYIPGNEAGLRDLAKGWLPANRPTADGTAWSASPLATQVRGMDDLALSVVLVGDENTLRMWMEQVEPNITTPIIAATSAFVEPQARNYVNAKQLQGSLRGLTGAAELELLTNTAGQAVKTVDSLSLVSLTLAGIIIAANVLWLMRRGKK
ncbi:MAG: zinc-ribbon domain-containing protein [Chloroflexota bacterium]|nr:MAG: zinc-ribbon domain-containing protein [Chloroflexota bacterium]